MLIHLLPLVFLFFFFCSLTPTHLPLLSPLASSCPCKAQAQAGQDGRMFLFSLSLSHVHPQALLPQCTNCAAACKKCDESRPCERCLKYGTANSCVDGQRKERKKGIKRGPYKRKNKSDTPDTYSCWSHLVPCLLLAHFF